MSKKTQKPQLNIPVVSGSISFIKHSICKTRINAKSNINLLDDDVVIDTGEDYIKISRPDIDYNGKTYKLNKMKSGWYGTTLQMQLPLGKFLFDDEESTEDELIAYYR